MADDYYKQGLTVNQVLKRDQQAVDLGVQATVMRSGNQLRIVLAGSEKFRPPTGITLKIMHPTQGGEDQIIALVTEGQGVYSGKLIRDLGGRRTLALEDASGLWRLYGNWQADTAESQKLVAGETAATINPVSYTHLDVYKRQSQGNAQK